MPASVLHPLTTMVDMLARRARLDAEDRAALLDLSYSVRSVEPGSYLVRDGDNANRCSVILNGFAVRHKISDKGLRQIVSIQIHGDILDFENLYLGSADHNVQTLTRCQIMLIPHDALRNIIQQRPAIGVAILTNTMTEASRYREWLLNIGRRGACARVAHLFCELAVRLDVPGRPPGQGYELPMTQEELGDAVGLTAVHVNRTLKGLVQDGLIVRDKRKLTFPDWNRLTKVADFNGRYLHIERSDGEG